MIPLDLRFSCCNNQQGPSTEIAARFPKVVSVKHDDAATRVRQRIDAWTKVQGHGSKKQLADAVTGLYGYERSATWVSDVVHGRQDLRLRDLDAVADAMDVPPGDLVRRSDRQYLEVTNSEARLLRYFRALPETIRAHWLAYLDYLYSFHERALAEQAAERKRRTEDAQKDRTRKPA